ncbi:hypothetical protein [Janibacter melonis]|uniref:hypothetical protein n=1 Tax=Janibacter melonis TaxID=262209 RepID=UPI001CD5ADE4|nr:hypothetical protein [Janibacter melonis]
MRAAHSTIDVVDHDAVKLGEDATGGWIRGLDDLAGTDVPGTRDQHLVAQEVAESQAVLVGGDLSRHRRRAFRVGGCNNSERKDIFCQDFY